MKAALLRYFLENFDDLLAFDLKLARMLGAPAPHTISSWVHFKKWALLEKIINKFFQWFVGQDNHCETDYKRVAS